MHARHGLRADEPQPVPPRPDRLEPFLAASFFDGRTIVREEHFVPALELKWIEAARGAGARVVAHDANAALLETLDERRIEVGEHAAEIAQRRFAGAFGGLDEAREEQP